MDWEDYCELKSPELEYFFRDLYYFEYEFNEFSKSTKQKSLSYITFIFNHLENLLSMDLEWVDSKAFLKELYYIKGLVDALSNVDDFSSDSVITFVSDVRTALDKYNKDVSNRLGELLRKQREKEENNLNKQSDGLPF